MLVVHPALPARTVSEFIAHAKAHPGRLNYASSGNGSSAHLSMEMLKKQTEIDVVHVPYKGAPQALLDLLAGDINAMFGNVPAQLPHLKSGKIRALAVTTAKRDFPAAGYSNYDRSRRARLRDYGLVWGACSRPRASAHPLRSSTRTLVKTLEDARDQGAPGGAGRRAHPDHAGRVRGVSEIRSREMVEAREGLGRDVRMSRRDDQRPLRSLPFLMRPDHVAAEGHIAARGHIAPRGHVAARGHIAARGHVAA